MKKTSLIIASLLLIFTFSACNSNQPKKVELKTLNDSINYSLGHWQGSEYRVHLFQDDSTGVKQKAFIKTLNETYKKNETEEMYHLGVNVGRYFKDHLAYGHFGDSTMKGDIKVILRGMINGANGYEDIMTKEEADAFLQAIQQRIFEQDQADFQLDEEDEYPEIILE